MGDGALCRFCLSTAVECQHTFVDSGMRSWCCWQCRINGPRAMHTLVVEDHTQEERL